MEFAKNLELAVILISVVSCMFSMFVMLTYFMFPEMRRKLFMKLIFHMSLADFGMNVVSAFGFPPNGSALCWIQGICQIYFAASSWLWTTVLSYSVYSIMRYERLYLSENYAHLLCWGLPLIMALVPISTSNYGAPDPDYQWCIWVSRAGTPNWTFAFWTYVSFFGWFFLCVFLMVVWTVLIFIRLVWQKTIMSDVVKKTYSKVWLYPIVMVVCWFLNYSILQFPQEDGPFATGVSMILGILNGVISAIIFLVKSEEARQRWHSYFFVTPSLASLVEIASRPSSTIVEDFAEDDVDFRVSEVRSTFHQNFTATFDPNQSESSASPSVDNLSLSLNDVSRKVRMSSDGSNSIY